MPHSEHDHGNTSASSAWTRPLIQPVIAPPIALGREHVSQIREDRNDDIEDLTSLNCR
jgi:hypothetical protein